MAESPPPVSVIGIGDDGPAGLTAPVREAIAQADVLIGGQRHLSWFPDHPVRRIVLTSNLDRAVAQIAGEMLQHRIAVLASGDPLFYGIGGLLSQTLGPHRVQIIPFVSSIQLAFARVATSWHDAVVLSAHGRPLAPVIRPVLDAPKVALLTDGKNTPGTIATALIAAGMENCRTVICEHLGGTAERIVDTRLFEVPQQTFASLNVMLLLREAPQRPLLALGLPDGTYDHTEGQITKAEVRAVTLAKLGLRREGVLWDIGAGSGSVSIEAASLTGSRVYAIERNPDQIKCINANIAAHHAPNVTVVEGEAPTALEALPPPDSVFIGGSGGQLSAILGTVYRVLPAGGRVVLNLILLSHLQECREWFSARSGWHQELLSVHISRAVPVAGDVRLASLNPVWILAAQKME
ncbi:MAG: precorrin-6y C5,15-methyltransferase (decarboxylating) subunit CbiE [Chloroflexi bacterium]|nr:precorrin-6y C5,15-methyltransferase (decarboxylating) subunit CbiE [Chloroflexota bacterium]